MADSQGQETLTEVHAPPMVLVSFSKRARQKQRPSVPRTKEKGPTGPCPLLKLHCTPSGLPPWKPPPTLANCPRGCLGCLGREPSSGRQGCGSAGLIPGYPASLPPWPPSPAARWKAEGGGMAGLRSMGKKLLESCLHDEVVSLPVARAVLEHWGGHLSGP